MLGVGNLNVCAGTEVIAKLTDILVYVAMHVLLKGKPQ